MYGMSTWQILWTLPANEHVFTTYRTVVFVFVRHAIVGVVDGDGYAHAAGCAVSEVGASTHTTEAALVTVEGTFGKCHPYVAFGTMIFSKVHATLDA